MDAISDVSRGSEIFSSVPVFPPLQDPLNLDDLFGFSETARKRYATEETVQPKHFLPNKIFINHVDSFTGKYITSVLSGKDDIISIQQDLNNSMTQDTTGNIRNVDVVTTNTEKSTKPKKTEKEEQVLNEGTMMAKHSNENAYRDDIISNLSLKGTIEDLEGRFQGEKCLLDTSKLTVAEYYEMMELDTLGSRTNFLKDKLGKFSSNAVDLGTLNNELESIPQDRSFNYEIKASEFEIIGTTKNLQLQNVHGVKEIIRTSYEDPDFLKEILTCGIIIYIVHENLDQTAEATWVLNSIINFIDELKNTQNVTFTYTPIFILVSTFMTWSLTKPLSLNYPELPFTEKDFRKRKPHPNYESLFELEEQIIKAQFEQILKSVIIVSGIPYGHEENELRYLFDMANCYHHLPIYSPGNNFVPTVHVENLGQVVKQTLIKIDSVTNPFIFAKDPAQDTMAQISRAVSSSFGTGYCELQHKEFAFINDMISQDLYNKLTTNIFLESCYPLFKEEDIPWKYQLGFSENINLIVNEFIHAEKINPFRVVLYGNSLCDRLKNIALKISECCHIPHIKPTSIIHEYCEEVLGKETKLEDQKLRTTVGIETRFKDVESPPELMVCDDEKYIDGELDFLKKLNINTSDDVKLLSENDKASIVARKLKMRPYVYHGYILEEYPQNLKQANVMFSLNNKEVFESRTTKNISILPDMVIFFNEVEDSIFYESNESSIHSSQNQTIEADYQDSIVITSLEDTFEGENEEGSRVVRAVESKNQELDPVNDIMLHFFSNLDKTCLTFSIDYRKSEDEDEILNKTLDIIQNVYNCDEQFNLKSSSVNKHSHFIQANIEDNSMNDTYADSKSESVYENKCTDILKETEEIILAVRSYPLLSYLINFISPTLTTGILEVADQIPQDPIDFLAEYIFKCNPSGRMMPHNELTVNDLSMNPKTKIPTIDSKACFA